MMKVKIKGILLVIGSIFWFSGCNGEEEMIFFPSESTETTYEEKMTVADTQVFVYVCGAVYEPGVVALPADARVVDAVAAAGGMTAEAAESYVNLAAKLTDGEKIYIPTKVEVAGWEAVQNTDAKVNINTADKETLCSLPGIGESKAEEIITYRKRNGFFQSLEELMNVPGIKESLFEKIADLIKLE